MSKRVSAAEAKAQLSALVAEVAYGGQHIIIERRGKPLAALVSIKELERLERDSAPQPEFRGFLELAGAWGDILSDEEIDEFIAHIYAEREKDMGRPVILEE